MEIRITKAQTTLFVPINKLPGVSLFDYITLLRCYKRPLLIRKDHQYFFSLSSDSHVLHKYL